MDAAVVQTHFSKPPLPSIPSIPSILCLAPGGMLWLESMHAVRLSKQCMTRTALHTQDAVTNMIPRDRATEYVSKDV